MLLIFLVPFLIVEPLLVVATVAIAMGYVVSGAIAWIVLKILAVGLIPAIFDLTQHKLMTMPWFVRAYDKVMAFHHYADQIVAPYKEAAAALLRQWRLTGGRGDEAGSRTSAARGALRRPPTGGERQAAGGLARVDAKLLRRSSPLSDPSLARQKSRREGSMVRHRRRPKEASDSPQLTLGATGPDSRLLEGRPERG